MKSLSILLAANPMNRKLVLSIFLLAYALLLGSAFAQPATTAQPVPVQAQPAPAAAVNTASTGDSHDAELARIEAEVRRNREALAIRQASQAFWLQVLQTLMPIVSAIGMAFVVWLQVKAQRERSLMAQSINGMKTELVANTRAAAFHEGALLEREKDNPQAPPVVQRGQQLLEDARKAGEAAAVSAAKAAGEKPSPLIGQPPSTPPSDLAPDTPPKA